MLLVIPLYKRPVLMILGKQRCQKLVLLSDPLSPLARLKYLQNTVYENDL